MILTRRPAIASRWHQVRALHDQTIVVLGDAIAAINGGSGGAVDVDAIAARLLADPQAKLTVPPTVDAIATAVDARLLDDGDATDLITAIVARIDNTNINEASLVAAVKAALFDAESATHKLSVSDTGRASISTSGLATPGDITAAQNAIITRGDAAWVTGSGGGGGSTGPTATAIAAAVRAELASELAKLDQNVSAPKTLTAATLGTLFGDVDAAQMLTDIFAGVFAGFDESSDPAVQTFAAAGVALLITRPELVQLFADAAAAKAAAVAAHTSSAAAVTAIADVPKYGQLIERQKVLATATTFARTHGRGGRMSYAPEYYGDGQIAVYPTAGNVRAGIVYGPGGDDYTGTLAAGAAGGGLGGGGGWDDASNPRRTLTDFGYLPLMIHDIVSYQLRHQFGTPNGEGFNGGLTDRQALLLDNLIAAIRRVEDRDPRGLTDAERERLDELYVQTVLLVDGVDRIDERIDVNSLRRWLQAGLRPDFNDTQTLIEINEAFDDDPPGTYDPSQHTRQPIETRITGAVNAVGAAIANASQDIQDTQEVVEYIASEIDDANETIEGLQEPPTIGSIGNLIDQARNAILQHGGEGPWSQTDSAFGDATLSVLVVDDADSTPIQGARVTIRRPGQSGFELTNAAGMANRGAAGGTWDLIVVAAGYEVAEAMTVTVPQGAGPKEVRLGSIVAPATDDPALCAVTVRVINQHGVPIENAIVTARLQGGGNFVNPAMVLNQSTDQRTGPTGQATLLLIRATQFQRGDGRYVITVAAAGGSVTPIQLIVPDEPSLNIDATHLS